jgi:acyl CoA:acetate/3-ketoacid CoA transferase
MARIETLDGREWIYVPAIPVDVAIIRATTADPYGNLTFEDEAAVLGTLDTAVAAHNNGGVVIAQVKRTTTEKHLPREVHVPGALVDAIVVAPTQEQAGGIFFDPAISGTEIKSLDEIESIGFDITKVIARRAAMELHHYDLANLGFGISANVPRILMEEGLDGEVTWVIEQARSAVSRHRQGFRGGLQPGRDRCVVRPVHPASGRRHRHRAAQLHGGLAARRCQTCR